MKRANRTNKVEREQGGKGKSFLSVYEGRNNQEKYGDSLVILLDFYRFSFPILFIFYVICMAVTIIIQNNQGEEISRFPAQQDVNLSGQANQHQAEVPLACCSGACMVCACKVIAGAEFIDKEKFGNDLIGAQDDMVLTCVSGVKDECFDEGFAGGEIILQKSI